MTITAQAGTDTIEANARTVKNLLGEKYAIDYYQREYAWKERQVRELIDDLTGKFLEFYDADHSRRDVEKYGHYFLGSIVISRRGGKRFIVDGQQRLTTLTLLLIHLDHLQEGRGERVAVRNLIFSERFGDKSFNIDVPDRKDVMHKLMAGVPVETDDESPSVRNLVARYENIADHLPEEVTGPALPYFMDWLLEKARLVEIEASSDEDAYTIFETMNERGLPLSMPDMLKGYVLAKVRQEGDRQKLEQKWKKHMRRLNELGEGEEVAFFKRWLRARHAETMRPGRKGAKNLDYERIGNEFHRWVRDDEVQQRLGLTKPDAFVQFVSDDMGFHARQYTEIRGAAHELISPWESVYYNADRAFTLQTQALLASLVLGDEPEEIRRKIAIVADFLDIWLARRVWNFKTVAYSSVKYTLFTLTKELRGRDVGSVSEYLLGQLDEQAERFADEPLFRLHRVNSRQVKHILARMTDWVETQCDRPSIFRKLAQRGRARPFEIEHIWSSHYSKPFTDWFSSIERFEIERGRLGGLILIPRRVNQSLGDKEYKAKRQAYLSNSENILARSLHPDAYKNMPAFQHMLKRSGLPFRSYDSFGPAEQSERQELYVKIAERVWDPSRLESGGPTEDAS